MFYNLQRLFALLILGIQFNGPILASPAVSQSSNQPGEQWSLIGFVSTLVRDQLSFFSTSAHFPQLPRDAFNPFATTQHSFVEDTLSLPRTDTVATIAVPVVSSFHDFDNELWKEFSNRSNSRLILLYVAGSKNPHPDVQAYADVSSRLVGSDDTYMLVSYVSVKRVRVAALWYTDGRQVFTPSSSNSRLSNTQEFSKELSQMLISQAIGVNNTYIGLSYHTKWNSIVVDHEHELSATYAWNVFVGNSEKDHNTCNDVELNLLNILATAEHTMNGKNTPIIIIIFIAPSSTYLPISISFMRFVHHPVMQGLTQPLTDRTLPQIANLRWPSRHEVSEFALHQSRSHRGEGDDAATQFCAHDGALLWGIGRIHLY